MIARRTDVDVRAAVIVPARPGPLVRLADLERGRDELDELLDDVLGEADDRGPGLADAVLIVGGLGAVIAAQAASLPGAVTFCGAVAIGLGVILPLRSLSRRLGSARRTFRVKSMLGDGSLLQTDHPAIGQLLAAHDRLLNAAASLARAPQERVHEVAHAALLEVASLLDGRPPLAKLEVDYVAARTQALQDLGMAAADPRVGDGETDQHRALVEARQEVEHLAGNSSLTDASNLSRELLGTDEP